MNPFRFLRGIQHRRSVQRLTSTTPTRQQRYHTISTAPVRQSAIDSRFGNFFSSLLRRWLKRDGWALLGIMILLVVGGWYIGFHSQRFLIRHIEVSGNQFITTAEMKNYTNSFLLDRTLSVIPRDTFWTLHTDALQQYLSEALRDQYALESLMVTKEYPSTVHITIQERIPSVTWVTTDEKKDRMYTVIDEDGIVTHIVDAADVNPAFPFVRDKNRAAVELGAKVISSDFIHFLLALHTAFPAQSGIEVDSYVFPLLTCQKQEYVAEKIFQQEILNSSSTEYKEKKRSIQERFQRGELTIDQSLEELELVKNEEIKALNQNTNNTTTRTNWETVFTDTPCDFVAVGHEIHVVTSPEGGGFLVYLDTTLDMTTQLQNVRRVLSEKITNRSTISYIDARYEDRVYYK